KSSVCWSRKSWSTMTPSRSGTRSRPKHQRRPPAVRRYRQTANSGSAMKVTFCVRGVISPILSNLFLHYTFDLWMRRAHPDLPWCRYADDGLVHCRTEQEAEGLKAELQARLEECRLQMHPTKTKIVYCKDGKRKGRYPNVT